jgi:O-antigen/teichoic acid export membrane protein
MLFVGVLIVTVVAVLGPESMRGLYGPGFAAARSTLTVLGAAVGVYLVASTFSQALLALDSAGRAAAAWAASAALFCVLEAFVLPGDPLARVSWAFLIATLVCAALLGLLVTGRLRTR